MLFAVATVLVAVPFGLLLVQVVSEGPMVRRDAALARWLNVRVHDRPLVVDLLEAISFLGKPILLYLLVGLPVLWLVHRRRWHLVTFLLVTCLLGGLVDTAVKVLVARPRPELDDPITTAAGHSFPSGHSMSATVCYGALILVFSPLLSRRFRRAAVAVTALVVLAIGLSRLALGVHFLSDVLGGFVLGAAWLVASTAAFETWREERGLRRTDPVDQGIEPEEVADLIDQDPSVDTGSDAENRPTGRTGVAVAGHAGRGPAGAGEPGR